MSQKELEAVIGRAIVDKEFRNRLFADPGATLEAYELSEAELAALRKMDVETLDAYGGTPGIRYLQSLGRTDSAERS
jgi:hypothetical protein